MGTFEIRQTVNEWHATQTPVALCTVSRTWGSSPRRTGAKMAVTAALGIAGSVSGGCVEAAVIEQALNTLEDGQLRRLHFDVADDTALGVGLACGGSISIVVEPLDVAWWQVLEANQRRRLATVTLLAEDHPTPPRRVITAQGEVVYAHGTFPAELDAALPAALNTQFAAGASACLRLHEHEVMIDLHLPQPRLVMVGGAHVAVALQHIAAALGFRVLLIDPRKAFATHDRFPAVEHIHHAYPDAVLPTLELDADTYLVVLSHDAKIDDPALLTAMRSEVRYIGVMSSRRTHVARRERLHAKGATAAELARLSVPIGLNLGARTPEEIALSIMAEIVAVKNGQQTV
jgi:xanthine dehydrogenase accessory factor